LRVHKHYDVVIVGGGIAGATAACALSDQGLSLAMVEAHPQPESWPADTMDLRVSAVTPVSERIFSRLGVWDEMRALGVSPYRQMHVWDAAGDDSIHFDSADVATEHLGHIVENRVMQCCLWQRLNSFADVDVIAPAAVQSLRPGKRTTLQLDNHRRISASLVVGADGGRSRIRHHAGIGVHGWSYRQHALVTMVKTGSPHGETAWQRFLPEGPLAFLPLRNGWSSIVWSTSLDRAAELEHCGDDAFRRALGEAIDFRLGEILDVGGRVSFPLQMQQAAQYVCGSVVLIGDAAHTIHPLAGQGANLGILDAVTLAAVLCQARDAGSEPFDAAYLRRYERWRKAENTKMIVLMEGFKRLFSNANPVLSKVRGLGLRFTDACSPAKDHILRHHNGVGCDYPPIALP